MKNGTAIPVFSEAVEIVASNSSTNYAFVIGVQTDFIAIHIGSQQAGPRMAAILSVVESCRRFKIPMRSFFSVPKEKMLSTPASSHFENSRHHITAGLILPPMSP